MSEDLREVSAALETQRLRERLRNTESRLKDAEENAADLESQLELAIEIQKRKRSQPLKRQPHGRGDVTACIIASDWHLEERVKGNTVNGLNEYSLSIAAKRAEKFFQKALFLSDIHKQKLNVHNLCIGFLGDIISGQLREEAIETSQLSPTEAVLFAFDQIHAGLRLLIKEGGYDQIDVVCASGNHGRTILKPRSATRVSHSFEWLLYKMLEREFSGNDRVRFIIETGYHVWHQVAGHKVRFHHGDAIKYQGGIGGVTIPVNKAIAAWNRASAAYLDVFGHWHQSLDGGRFVCNGSLIGYNAFAVEIKAEYEEPKQQYFLIDKERGKILTAPIFVEGKS